jgi:hypothetical protein
MVALVTGSGFPGYRRRSHSHQTISNGRHSYRLLVGYGCRAFWFLVSGFLVVAFIIVQIGCGSF